MISHWDNSTVGCRCWSTLCATNKCAKCTLVLKCKVLPESSIGRQLVNKARKIILRREIDKLQKKLR